MESLIAVNHLQTKLTKEVKESLPKEVYNNILEYISEVEYIKRLISPVRGYIKDRPIQTYKDTEGNEVEYEDGRRVIDLSNPHILEDMDFFRERAIFYEKNGRYTNLTPNGNVNSEYASFWKEELRRWKHGLVRPDGEWIPGELYFYWNYSRIWLVEQAEGTRSTSRGERVHSFPKAWSGDYLFFHYVVQGKEEGAHGKLLKARGVGFEQPNSELVKTANGDVTVGSVNVGDKLIGIDGLETNVLELFPQGEKDVYRVELMDGRTVTCGLDHLWYVNDYTKKRVREVKLSEMIDKGLYWKINKGKNKSYKYSIPKLSPVLYTEKELNVDPYVLGLLLGDGSLTGASIKLSTNDEFTIEEVERRLPGFELRLDKHTKNNYICVDTNRFNYSKDDYENGQYGANSLNRAIIDLGLNVSCFNKFIPEEYKLSSISQRKELLQGLMDSDGSVSAKGNKEFSNSNYTLIKDVADVARSLGYKCRLSKGRAPRKKVIMGVECNIKQEYRLHIITNDVIFKIPRKVEICKVRGIFNENAIVNITKLDYKEESTCFLVDNDTNTYLTRDFIPTHNSFKAGAWTPRNMYVYPGTGNANFHLASDKGFLTGDKGIWGKVLDTLDWIADNTPMPKIRSIDRRQGVLELQLGYDDEYGVRRGLQSSVTGISLKDNPDKARGVRGVFIHYEEDGLFPDLEKAWNVNRRAVEDGEVAFGYQFAGGTGGVTGKSFAGSEKLFYSTDAYNIYGIPNVFDKNADGRSQCGFFWGAYLNRNGCYDSENGESDVIKALIEIELERHKVKTGSSDPNALTQIKAELPITPQEAVMRTEGTVFPVADLRDHIENISSKKDRFLAEHYVGDLIYNSVGNIEWKPNADLYPLRQYEFSSDNRYGAVEIFEMPRENAQGEIPYGRYIAGIDPIDSDTGQSLFSVIVMDLFTDRIVAEYSGRPRTAKEAYEISLRLLKFYRAQANYEQNLKGLFAYFEQHNSLNLLCPVPQILKDMEMVRATNLYGNKALGTRANKQINSWGRQLQADWQLSRVDSGDDEDTRLNLHTLRGMAYIEECIKWNSDGNFDRVSAGGMLFILREDRFRTTQSAKDNKDNDRKSLANDSFFEANYDNKYSQNSY